jgi:streptomycin 6-kinase
MELPPAFIATIRDTYDNGAAWLEALPGLLAQCAREFNINLAPTPFALSYSYVVACTRMDGSPAVLKLAPPNDEFTSEVAALRLHNAHVGSRYAQVYEADPARGVVLLERVAPGTPLLHLQQQDDDAATRIAAQMLTMPRLRPTDARGLLSLPHWGRALSQHRNQHAGHGSLPPDWFALAERLFLRDQHANIALCHGDFHHANILSAGKGWKLIDPKGVLAPPEFEAAQFLLNPWCLEPDWSAQRLEEIARACSRRLGILQEVAGFNRGGMIAWTRAKVMLDLCWEGDPAPATVRRWAAFCDALN